MNCKYKQVVIKKSTKPEKKLMAVFDNKKTIYFGQSGFSDFTKNDRPPNEKNKQKENYIKRHSKRENHKVCDTAGSLSRWVLWNKKTIESSIKDYKSRFNLK